MKVECVDDTALFIKMNITKGKVYEATPVVSRDIWVKFIIFNDANKWELYDAKLFIPASALTEIV